MLKVFYRNFPCAIAILLYLLIYIVRLYQGGWSLEVNLFHNYRELLDQQITQLLPSPQSQLLSGILLGQKKDLPAEFKVALRDTSTLHIVVVSGQNLTMLAGVFLSLAGIISRRVAIGIAFIAILFYTMLTGAQVPVIRAAIMSGISLTAVLFGRQKAAGWILVLSGGLMLLINPIWITDLSFQLSFLATMGVILLAPAVLEAFRALPNFIKQDLAVTIGAQLMVVPIIAQNFYQFSIVGVFTNVLVGWIIPIVMILGAIMLGFAAILPGTAQIIALVLNVFLSYFVLMVEYFASLRFAWVYIGEQSILLWIGYYLVIGGILWYWNQRKAMRG